MMYDMIQEAMCPLIRWPLWQKLRNWRLPPARTAQSSLHAQWPECPCRQWQDTMHLLFTTMAYRILQMCSANCGNNNQLFKIKKENDKNIPESKKKQVSFYNTIHNTCIVRFFGYRL